MKDKIYHQPNLAKSWFLALLCFLALCMQSCRDSDTVISSEPEDTGSKAEKGDVMGLYLLNQGNMGSNKGGITPALVAALTLFNLFPALHPRSGTIFEN